MLVDFKEILPIIRENRTNHAWIIETPIGFGFSEIADLIPANQVVKLAPSLHAAQKTELINIDDIREILPMTSSSRSSRLFIIIEAAEKMNEPASNALLKKLEEPGLNTVFVLLTENSRALLPTVRSRAQVLRLRQPNLTETWAELDPNGKISVSQRAQIDFLAHGSRGLMKELIEDHAALKVKVDSVNLAKQLLSNDYLERMEAIFKIKKSTKNRELTDEVCRICLEICLKNAHNDLTFRAKYDIIKRCGAFETVLSQINNSNTSPSLWLAAECAA